MDFLFEDTKEEFKEKINDFKNKTVSNQFYNIFINISYIFYDVIIGKYLTLC